MASRTLKIMPSKHKPDDVILAVRMPRKTRERAYKRAENEGDILATRLREWVDTYVETGLPIKLHEQEPRRSK